MRQFFCKTITLKKLLGRKFHVERTKLQTGCKNLTQNLQTFRYTASQRQKHLNLLYDFFHLGCSMSYSWFSYRSTIRAWIQKWAVSGSITTIMLLILAHCTSSCNHRLWTSRRGFYLWSPACFFASASPFMQLWAHGKII
jgi:hypothetical protein